MKEARHGLGFPFVKVTPGVIVGILSLILLAIAIFALYARHLQGRWPRTYVITAMVALYLDIVTLVGQAFERAHAIHALAPTLREGPFLIAQLFLLIVSAVLIITAAKKFRPVPE